MTQVLISKSDLGSDKLRFPVVEVEVRRPDLNLHLAPAGLRATPDRLLQARLDLLQRRGRRVSHLSCPASSAEQ